MFDFQPSYSILSIDGGGIRGVIPAMILIEIEKRISEISDGAYRHVAEVFDLIAGTSTGGILASGLNITGEDRRPTYAATELLDLYAGPEGKRIFSRKYGMLSALRMLFGSKFPATNLETILEEKFGDFRLSETFTDLLITSYDTELKKPFYFTTHDARLNPDQEDFPLRYVARATSAAPTYFPPTQIPWSGTNWEGSAVNHLALVDGGVFANNPSVLAYVHARERWKTKPQYQSMVQAFRQSLATVPGKGFRALAQSDNFDYPFLLVSIGTGQTRRPYPYAKTKGWWVGKWVQPIIDILMQGVSESVHYQMEYLLPPYREDELSEPIPRYYRLNIEVKPEHSGMDDVSDANIQALMDYGKRIIEENDEALETICNILFDIAETRQVAQD